METKYNLKGEIKKITEKGILEVIPKGKLYGTKEDYLKKNILLPCAPYE